MATNDQSSEKKEVTVGSLRGSGISIVYYIYKWPGKGKEVVIIAVDKFADDAKCFFKVAKTKVKCEGLEKDLTKLSERKQNGI